MFWTVTISLLRGFLMTLKLFGLTLLFSLPLGLFICFNSMSRNPVLRLPFRFLIWIIRGTPLLLQLLVFYYGPGILFHTNLWGSGDSGRFFAALAAFVINYACYFSEIYRGGIQSIPVGQYEAGQVLGMTKGQIFRKIIFLQVIKRIVPPISNEIIWSGQSFIKAEGIIWPLFYTGAFYLIFSGLLTILFHYIERKLNYFR